MTKPTKSILDYTPKKYTPRDIQRDTLLALESKFSEGNVFVINLPTGAGKSYIAMTLCRWLKEASIITPNRMLVEQYKSEYKSLHVMRGKRDYYCDIYKCGLNLRPKSKKHGSLCKDTVNCKGCAKYRRDNKISRVTPFLLSNYYTYMAHKLFRPTLIADEAHQLIPMVKELAAVKLWKKDYNFPHNIYDREDITTWVNTLPEHRFEEDDKLIKLRDEVNSDRPYYSVDIIEDNYHGKKKSLIKMTPVDVSSQPPRMWPSSVKNIILMSATISRKDIEQLGLSKKKVVYIDAPSPITAENRPVVIHTERCANMSYKYQEENTELLAEYIKDIADMNEGEKGIVHATYGIANRLRKYLNRDPRFLFHDKDNKADRYSEYINSKDVHKNTVLIASGMYEGIDLPYDKGRWQVISKIPYPFLGDPAIKFLLSKDKDYYQWETIKTVLQASGRICRTLDDYGETFIFDSSFIRLYEQGSANQFFPNWFKDAVRFI